MPVIALVELPAADKLGHAALFFVQAWLLHRALLAQRGAGRWALPVVLAAAVAWGAITELAQRWVPGRDADVLDLVADVAGALGWGGLEWLSRRRRRAPGAAPGRTGRARSPALRRP